MDLTNTSKILRLICFFKKKDKFSLRVIFEGTGLLYYNKVYDGKLKGANGKLFEVVYRGKELISFKPITNERTVVQEKTNNIAVIQEVFDISQEISLLEKMKDFFAQDPNRVNNLIKDVQGNCFDYAHFVRELLITHFNLKCKKVFVYGSLSLVNTAAPDCDDEKNKFRFHVAVMIKIRKNNITVMRVIDPFCAIDRLFEFPDWISRISCKEREIVGVDFLDSSFYIFGGSDTDALKLAGKYKGITGAASQKAEQKLKDFFAQNQNRKYIKKRIIKS